MRVVRLRRHRDDGVPPAEQVRGRVTPPTGAGQEVRFRLPSVPPLELRIPSAFSLRTIARSAKIHGSE